MISRSSVNCRQSITEAYLIIERGPEGVIDPLIVHTLAIFDGD